jgi:hypothetical protein
MLVGPHAPSSCFSDIERTRIIGYIIRGKIKDIGKFDLLKDDENWQLFMALMLLKWWII